MDDLLPTIDGKLACTHSSLKDEYWVSLVEKAYAKLVEFFNNAFVDVCCCLSKLCCCFFVFFRLHGSYEDLEDGHISDVLVDMTGGVSEIIDLKSGECESDEDRRSDFLRLLTTEMANHSIISASVSVSFYMSLSSLSR